jgi:hypothetical protein
VRHRSKLSAKFVTRLAIASIVAAAAFAVVAASGRGASPVPFGALPTPADQIGATADGTCSTIPPVTTGAPNTWICTGMTPALTVPGATLVVAIIGPPAGSGNAPVTVASLPSSIGQCNRSGAVPATNEAPLIDYICGPGQSIPSGTSVVVSGIDLVQGTVQLKLTANYNPPTPSPTPASTPTAAPTTAPTVAPAVATAAPATPSPAANATSSTTGSAGAASPFSSASVSGSSGTGASSAGSASTTGNSGVSAASSASSSLAASGAALSNVALAGVPLSGDAGQSLTFSAAPAGTSSSCGSIQSYSFDFGDGSTPATGQTVTHVYGASGNYSITLTVTDCAGNIGTATGAISITGSAASSPSSSASSTASAGGSGPSVRYLSGWNLVSGPAGTSVAGATGSEYTYQAGDSDYETLAPGQPLQVGEGYWAYFLSPATGSLSASGAQTFSVFLPAGQWVMVGNPGSTTANVSGSDGLLVFDPTGNTYVPATTLAPGQGGWALSLSGAAVTVAGQ